ncbi:MAG: DNA polymerase III subunit beta, partial [Bdellovibrionota bacterium]
MEFIIPTSELSKALYLAHNIVEKRTTMPILSNVLISASKSKLEVSATDLEITAKVSVPADVKVSGSTTVNAKMLADIVRELPETKIELKLSEGERLEISANNTNLKLIGVSSE